MPSSGAPVAEGGIPGEAAGQQVAGGGELLADEAQAEEPGAHGVLGVVVLLGLGAGGLDRLRHLAQCEAKLDVALELSGVEAVPALGGGGVELEKPELDRTLGEGSVEVEHMVAAVVVVLVPAVGGVVGAVPNVRQVAHGAGLAAVDRFDEPGADRPAVPAHAVVVEGQGIRQEALVAGHDVRQVAEGLGGVAFGPDVDVDSAPSGVVALGSSLAQPPHQLLEGVHVGVGEDWRDHLALFAVRPLDAHVPLELPLAVLGIPGRPGVVAVAVGGVLIAPGAEELGGELGGGAAGDAVHLHLDPDGLLFHLGDLVFHFLVHGADLRFLCVRRGVFPFGSDIFALKRRYSKSIRTHKVHDHSGRELCSLRCFIAAESGGSQLGAEAVTILESLAYSAGLQIGAVAVSADAIL